MASSIVPNSMRCFAHVEGFYARNVPFYICQQQHTSPPAGATAAATAATTTTIANASAAAGDAGAVTGDSDAHTTRSRALVEVGGNTYIVLTNFFVRGEAERERVEIADPAAPSPRQAPPTAAPAEETTPSDSFSLRSAMRAGTRHPAWEEDIPPAVSAALAPSTGFTLELRAAARGPADGGGRGNAPSGDTGAWCYGWGAPQLSEDCGADDGAGDDVVVARVRVDLSQLRYLGTSVAQADHALGATMTDRNSSGGGDGLHLLLRCVDGIFAIRTTAGKAVRDEGEEEEVEVVEVVGAANGSAGEGRVHAMAMSPSLAQSRLPGEPVAWASTPLSATGAAAAISVAHKHTRSSSALTAIINNSNSSNNNKGNFNSGGVGGNVYVRAGSAGLDDSLAPAPFLSPFLSAGRGISAGDAHALAVSTLAWKYLHALTVARRRDGLAAIDAMVVPPPARAAVAAEAAAAAAQAALSRAREALTVSTLTVEELRAAVGARQHQLRAQEERLQELADRQAARDSAAAAAATTGQQRLAELERAKARSLLAAARQTQVRGLAAAFPVVLSAQYAATLRQPHRAKDSIAGAPLPVFVESPGAGAEALQLAEATAAANGVVAVSSEELFAEALAMGHVAHVLVTLSALYSCALPHPIVHAGARSAVLRDGAVTAEAAAPIASLATSGAGEGACKVPLYCTRAAERPLLRHGLRLLLRDCRVLCRAMGRDEAAVRAEGLRIGAVLSSLLESG